MDLEVKDIRTSGAPEKGFLSFFEGTHDVPFEIKRIYFIHGVGINVERGGHAHKALTQFLVCLTGSIEILMDDGVEKETVVLDSPTKGLMVLPSQWHEMKWLEDNAVLLVAASDYYDESDYIRNYDDFLARVNDKGEN